MAQAALLNVWNNIWPYAIMLMGFSLIVFVHELGHFAVAKWAGVRVERFAIGFGKELFGITRGETRYSFNALPLGGYVKMLGQEDFDDKTNEWKFKNDPRSFANKPVGHRMAIVSAGVIMNIIFAAFLFMIIFLIGVETIAPRIAYIEADSPAEKAGLLPGDVIKKINGEKVLEFNEIRFAVMLAPPHEPIELRVERAGQLIPPLYITPEYRKAESTRDMQRQVIGIAQGVTRKIIAVGPDIDTSKPDSPHVGDVIVEVGGVKATDENASEILGQLPYANGDVIVERKTSDDFNATVERVKVNIPPLLALYPSDPNDAGTVSILGLAPLARFASVDSRGRAHLAGMEVGDTILLWDDVQYPSGATVARAVRDKPEEDIYFNVRKAGGKIHKGFIRPSRLARGQATIQALCQPITSALVDASGPKAQFTMIRSNGVSDRAGVKKGDVVLRCDEIENPTASQVNSTIRGKSGESVSLVVRRSDGSSAEIEVKPIAPGTIDANFSLMADDVLQTAEIVTEINGRPSSAAKAGIPTGAKIEAVNGQAVSTWRELVNRFREHAGSDVELRIVDSAGASATKNFHVPHSLHTLLGVGPEARILRIDQRETVTKETGRGKENLSVRYHEGMKAILNELMGREVAVEFRKDPFSPVETKIIAVNEDMVDPWLGRVQLNHSIMVKDETTILKGENAWEAIGIGVHKTYYFILQVYKTIQRMVFTKTVGVESISGPLGIIDMGGQVARAGFVKFLFFMAIISANLAVINFLPLPIVDGGLMVFLLIEKIKGSPVSLKVQVATQVIGLALIIGAFLFVTYQDAMRLWG